MKSVTHHIFYSAKNEEFVVYPIGDVHLGAAVCDEALFAHTVAEILANPNAYWVGLGDYCDFINRHDKRWRPSEEAAWLHDKNAPARAQIARFKEMIAPIRHKALALVKGNHEDVLLAKYEIDAYGEIADDAIACIPPEQYVGEPAFGAAGFIRLVFRFRAGTGTTGAGWSLTLWLHHGMGGGTLAGGKALNLERQLAHYMADAVLMGHTHVKQVVTRAIARIAPGGAIQTIERKGAFCGSYYISQDGIETYAERKGYPPLQTGIVKLIIRPGRKQFQFLT